MISEEQRPYPGAELAAPERPATPATQPNVRIVEPGKNSLRNLWRDIWQGRELLYFLTWRDVKVRYKQTVLGVVWAILQPVLSMVVLSIFFGKLAGIAGKTGVPYPIFVYSGLLPWTFFANALGGSSNSVISNASLITKVRFPRIMLPISAIGGGLVDFALAFIVLLGLMIWFHVPITGRILLAPFLVGGIAAIALGMGAIFAALTVSYRDFRYVIPFMTQVWMFMTPVIYPVGAVPPQWRWILWANPITGWISGFRYVFLGFGLNVSLLATAAAMTAALLFAGLYYFRATERRFADII